MWLRIALIALLCGTAFSSTESYYGYKVYDINAKGPFEKEIVYRLSENEDYDFFDLPRVEGKPARVMVRPEDQEEFENSLLKSSIDFDVINENVGESIEQERVQNEIARAAESIRVNFTSFQRFNNINGYLSELAGKYPHRVFVKTVGKSYQRRSLATITITNGDGRPNKKVIFIDAGIHAREWIAPAAALYVIHELVENFDTNKHLLRDYDWVILPVVNPDGYEYTFLKARMWRKTRKPVTNICVGTDGNRNFGYHWGDVGASTKPCSETFRGVSAFSEPETQVVRDLMTSLSGRAKMYLTMHSYGQYLLYPWGFTSELPSNWKDIDEVAQAGAKAIQDATGRRYTVGSSTNVLYEAAGGSDDYALAVAQIPISITMELPAGGSGFDPAPSQIKPFVSETWVGIKAMAEKVIAKF